MGHTDVVPVNPDGWSRDPFGGELIDGEVWGRGAIDMLNLTASMAVAFRHLARRGFRPKGTLHLLRRRRRGGRRPLGRGVDARPRTGRHRRGLRAHRDRAGWSSDDPRPARRSRSTSARRACCGAGCASAARPGTARCRSVPTTRSSRRPRSCAASRRTSRAPQIIDLWENYVDAFDLTRRPAQGAPRPRHRPRGVPHASRPGHRPARARLHAHDVLAERRPWRPEDERDPRRRRSRHRHPQ